ncbi:MAG: intradiol ring-cleavage dioxygenase [Burkholderiales bacterium]|jgi:protocatechuate 3,4-dioxygenase beta subunit
MTLSRRTIIGSGVLLAGAALADRLAAAEALVQTSTQTIGPFYPVERPLDQDADLTRIGSSSTPAKGQVIEVMGRVLGPDGRPAPFAKLDIWQANAAGRYAHPADDNPAPLDPGFQGAALITADAEGRYRFRTVKPGLYPGRTQHIHFDVTGRSQRLITQMYFAGEAGNAGDVLLSRLPEARREAMIAKLAQGTAVPTYSWDIVLLTA